MCDTRCDTSPVVPSILDFPGSDDGTMAQTPTRGPYVLIGCTDGAERERNRPGRRGIGLGEAVSGPVLRFVTSNFGCRRNFEIRPPLLSREI